MYTAPATTVGLAYRIGAGFPLTAGGCQCHIWAADAAFAGVNAVVWLTELCCGPFRYCGQSRSGPAAGAARATAAWGPCTAPARATAAANVRNPASERMRIGPPPGTGATRWRPRHQPSLVPGGREALTRYKHKSTNP